MILVNECRRTTVHWQVHQGDQRAVLHLGDDDDDSGNSPLSITEIPHLRAAVGCC